MESTFAGVPKMLNGKKFSQKDRTVVEELFRKSFLENRLKRYSELEDYLDKTSNESRISRLWIGCLIKPVLITMMYV